MRSTLDELLSVLAELESFIRSIEPIHTLLAREKDQVIQCCLTVRRRLDYSAFVIALYTAFEKYIEDLVWSFVETLSARVEYQNLPDKLRKQHIRQTGHLLLSGHLGEGRYIHVTDIDVIGNLNSCLSGQQPYMLNRQAIVYHDVNLRALEVQGMFTSIGIEAINDSTRRCEPLLEWYKKTTSQESPDKKIPQGVIDERVRVLVDRRNEVSHSRGYPIDLLGPEDMLEMLGFIKGYCSSLHKILIGEYLKRWYMEIPGAATQLGIFINGPLRRVDGTVIVVSKPSCRMFVGQPVFGAIGDRVDRWGYILEIQVDDVSQQSVEKDSKATEIGLKIDFKVTKHTELYVLQNTDEVVWS